MSAPFDKAIGVPQLVSASRWPRQAKAIGQGKLGVNFDGSGGALPSLYLGQVATNNRLPNFMEAGAGFKTVNSRTRHTATDDLVSVKIVVVNWGVVAGVETNPTGTGTATIEASVEYPAGDVNAVRVQFSGSDTAAMAAGATLVSDETAITIPSGAAFFVNQCRIVPSDTPMPCNSNSLTTLTDTSNGEAFEASASGTSKVMAASTMVSNQSTYWHGPQAILGMTRKSTVIILGDSIAFGQADAADGSTCYGVIARSLGSTYGHVNAGSPSGRASQFVSAHTKQMAFIATCGFTHAVFQYIRNDVSNSDTAPTIRGNLQSAQLTLKNAGLKVAQTTCTPKSTGAFTSLGAQTVEATLAVKTSVNTTLRTLLATQFPSVSAMFDTCSALESSQDSGKWDATGAIARTNDGTHPNPVGYAQVVSQGVINPNAEFFSR